MVDGIEVRLLGPVEVRLDGRDAGVGGAKQRTLIALLALHAGDVVPVQQVVEELWGEAAWGTSTGNVQMHVSRLRKVLTAAGDGTLIATGAGGYRLDTARETVDTHRFEALTAEARATG